MKKFRIGVTRDFLNPNNQLNFQIGLKQLDYYDNIEYEFFKEFTPVVQPEQIMDYDAVISLLPKFTEESFKGVERLTAIARCGVGYDMIDLKACTEADVLCFITPNAVRRPVAVSMLTFMLALSTRLFTKDQLTRSGRWTEKTNYMGWGVTGKTVGCVGLGGIAKEFFDIAKPLEIEMVAYDPFVTREEASRLGIKLVDFFTLLREADFVCITAPLTKQTYHLIDSKELDMMKASAFLINVGRGPIVNQSALTKALEEGRIRGAALDVFEDEPIDPKDPILKLDNVILSPHAIAWTDEMFREMGKEDIEGILKVSQGEIPQNIVNKDVLDRLSFKTKLKGYSQRAL